MLTSIAVHLGVLVALTLVGTRTRDSSRGDERNAGELNTFWLPGRHAVDNASAQPVPKTETIGLVEFSTDQHINEVQTASVSDGFVVSNDVEFTRPSTSVDSVQAREPVSHFVADRQRAEMEQERQRSGRGRETSFFGISTAADEDGLRVIYVIDSSLSMRSHGAAKLARDELELSLAALTAADQFQIIFYNTRPYLLSSSDGPVLLRGNDRSRRLARQFIGSMPVDGGTDHLAALAAALRLRPDVIFFLTDADEPRLSAADLAEIHRLNRIGAVIHAVEFTRTPSPPSSSFLNVLARENSGSHTRVSLMPGNDESR